MITDKLRGHLAMLTANTMWGLMSPVAKAVLLFGPVSYLSLTSFRMAGAAVVFWIASLFTKREPINRHDLFLLFWASLFAIVFNQGSFIMGVSMTSPVDASIITTTTPIFTMIISAIYLKESISWKRVLGIMIAVSGALLLILNSHHAATGNSHPASGVWGDLLCLLAQLSFSIYFVMFSGLTDRYSPVTLMKWMFTFATLCCVPVSYTHLVRIDYAALPLGIFLGIAFIVLGGTFLSYLLIPVGQRILRPTVASMYNYFQPMIAALLAVLWGMDSFGIVKSLAVLMIFSGVFLVTQSNAQTSLVKESVKVN